MPPSPPSVEELQHRIADLELLAYRSAHDLKGPLITLAHFLQGLPAFAKAGRWDEFDSDVARMARLLTQSQQMLDDLLQLARLDQPSAPAQPLSIPMLMYTAVGQLNLNLFPQGIGWSMHDSWPLVVGHESQLVAVFQNLLENAAKFSCRENDVFDIDLDYRRDQDQLVVMVRDVGVGIPIEDREKVFEPFVRLDSKQPGTGLGLCIVKRTIERHGGRVWIESPADGPGTVVCFTLPIAEP